MEEICKNCEWWGVKPAELNSVFENKGDSKQCGSSHFVYGYHIKNKDIPIDGMLVESDEDWGFYTGPEFGCIHFRSKKKVNEYE